MLTPKNETRRKTILILDNNCELEQLVREPLLKHLEKVSCSAVLVRAKDGADAARKSENQKFDIVLIDTEVPRLMDGGFVHGMRTYKNTVDADLIVISQKEANDLPEPLKKSRFIKKPYEPATVIDAMISTLNQQMGAGATATATANRFAVDVRVINAMINSTMKVLGQFGVASIKMDKATQKSPQDELSGEVSSVVEIKSPPFRGMLTVSFDKESFLEIASAMLMEEQNEITSENQDAAGEINNIIYGNAKAELSSFGVEMTVPKVLLGSHQSLKCPEGSAAMSIPFSTTKGKFYLTVIAVPV